LGVQLQLLEARGPNEFDRAFTAMAKEHVGALLVALDTLFVLHRARLADLAAGSRLPAAYGAREWWRPGVSCPTGRACLISGGAPRPTATRSSRAGGGAA